MQAEPRWNTRDFAAWVGRSERTVRRWFLAGVVPAECYSKIGGARIVIHPEAVRRLFGAESRR